MSQGVILTVGNDLMGDDGAGPLLARLLEAEPAPGWFVIDGGSVPENALHAVRARRPERLVIVDAARMELPPGSVRRIDEADVKRPSLFNTHIIPLDLLIESIRQSVPRVTFLGIQPGEVTFYAEITTVVREAVAGLHRSLVEGVDPDLLPRLAPADEEADR